MLLHSELFEVCLGAEGAGGGARGRIWGGCKTDHLLSFPQWRQSVLTGHPRSDNSASLSKPDPSVFVTALSSSTTAKTTVSRTSKGPVGFQGVDASGGSVVLENTSSGARAKVSTRLQSVSTRCLVGPSLSQSVHAVSQSASQSVNDVNRSVNQSISTRCQSVSQSVNTC